MERILYIHLQAEFLGRAGRNLDTFNFTGIHAIDSYFCPLRDAVDVMHIGVENKVTMKGFVLVANQKEGRPEERDRGSNENSDQHTMVFHVTSAPI
jgi:hypothetical protein